MSDRMAKLHTYSNSRRVQTGLNQHTDSSIPPHGLPALCLLMHYARGTGTNTFTDGFAVARQLQREDPEGYHLLTKYGYDAERDFVASRVDSPQVGHEHVYTSMHHRGLVVSVSTQPRLPPARHRSTLPPPSDPSRPHRRRRSTIGA